MNYYLLSLLLLATWSNCSAMEMTELEELNLYNEGSRELKLEFKTESMLVNGIATKYDDKEFFKTLNTVVSIKQKHYDYLNSAWKDVSEKQESTWYETMTTCCLESMVFLQHGFIAKLYDRYIVHEAFWKNEDASYDLFVRVLTLFEHFNNLRIEVGKAWPNAQLNLPILLSYENEADFEAYANVLQVDIPVSEWFDRMRATVR